MCKANHTSSPVTTTTTTNNHYNLNNNDKVKKEVVSDCRDCGCCEDCFKSKKNKFFKVKKQVTFSEDLFTQLNKTASAAMPMSMPMPESKNYAQPGYLLKGNWQGSWSGKSGSSF